MIYFNKLGFPDGHYLSVNDEENVREIIWDLIVERIVTIGINPNNPNWPWLKLTEYGKQAVDSAFPTPHDPSGYLRRLQETIPNIDPVIMTYLEESLKTYRIGAVLSSTIALGCASEKALLVLIGSFGAAIQDSTRRARFESDTKGKLIKRQFEILKGNLDRLKVGLPGDVTEGIGTTLIGVFEMIRNYRNDAGHPTGKSIPREQVYANLQVFVEYCKKIYQLKDYFAAHPIV